MFSTLPKIIYGIGFLIFLMIRKFYEVKFRKREYTIGKKNFWEFFFITLAGIGMVVPLVYIFSGVLDFADYLRPEWIMWAGVVFLLIGAVMLWRSHHDLGKNWTIVPAIRKKHTLITNGIYKHIRHPMYSAHFAWAIGQALVLPNWLAGLSFFVSMIPMYLFRVKKEEQVMIDEFGEEYKKYMKRTRRLV